MAPSVRARHMKSLVDALAALEPADAARVRARLSPALLADVSAAAGPEWLPFAADLEATRAVHGGLERAAFEAFFRRHQVESFGGPLFRAVVDGVVALFGFDPWAALRMVPRGWSLVFRDCGEWTAPRSIAPGHAEIELTGLPAEAVVDPVWPSAVAASLSAIVEVARARGGMSAERVDARARSVRFALRWTALTAAERR